MTTDVSLMTTNSPTATSPTATVLATRGLWNPLTKQKVLDLAVVYGPQVERSFSSWNPSSSDYDNIFPESTYTVSYTTPLPAAALSSSVWWSSKFSSTGARFLRVPRSQELSLNVATSSDTTPATTATSSPATSASNLPTSPSSTVSSTESISKPDSESSLVSSSASGLSSVSTSSTTTSSNLASDSTSISTCSSASGSISDSASNSASSSASDAASSSASSAASSSASSTASSAASNSASSSASDSASDSASNPMPNQSSSPPPTSTSGSTSAAPTGFLEQACKVCGVTWEKSFICWCSDKWIDGNLDLLFTYRNGNILPASDGPGISCTDPAIGGPPNFMFYADCSNSRVSMPLGSHIRIVHGDDGWDRYVYEK
ncbi:hypothetical protein BB8028_0007g00210 [Beauveria bassiana]|uniref:Uncharacterized protein n=1 Tax=Beauveria bassiana TaxID=176275 RepID=A0A2S7YL54_BEABA|nr:hypothetical protein BB8028_0007g00210 [Beauveria bassiana]